MFVILVYDVGEKRVQKIHKICKSYLTWVQNSVFEGEMTKAKYFQLVAQLKAIMKDEEDSLLIYKFRTKKYYERDSFGVDKPSSEDFIF